MCFFFSFSVSQKRLFFFYYSSLRPGFSLNSRSACLFHRQSNGIGLTASHPRLFTTCQYNGANSQRWNKCIPAYVNDPLFEWISSPNIPVELQITAFGCFIKKKEWCVPSFAFIKSAFASYGLHLTDSNMSLRVFMGLNVR